MASHGKGRRVLGALTGNEARLHQSPQRGKAKQTKQQSHKAVSSSTTVADCTAIATESVSQHNDEERDALIERLTAHNVFLNWRLHTVLSRQHPTTTHQQAQTDAEHKVTTPKKRRYEEDESGSSRGDYGASASLQTVGKGGSFRSIDRQNPQHSAQSSNSSSPESLTKSSRKDISHTSPTKHYQRDLSSESLSDIARKALTPEVDEVLLDILESTYDSANLPESASMNNLTSLISDMKTVNRECGADANIVDVSTCNTQTFPSHPNSKLHPNGILKPSVQFNLARSSDDIDGITNDSNANSQRQIFHQSQGASVKDVAGDLHDECSKSSETSESFVSPQPMASHGFQTRSQAEAEAMPNVPLRRPHATFTYVNGEEFKVRDSLERPLPQFPDTKKHSGQKMSTDHRTAEKMHTSAKTPEFFTPPNISFQRPARTTFQGMPNWEPLHSDFSALREAVSEATAVSRKTLLRDVAKDVGNYSTYQYAAGLVGQRCSPDAMMLNRRFAGSVSGCNSAANTGISSEAGTRVGTPSPSMASFASGNGGGKSPSDLFKRTYMNSDGFRTTSECECTEGMQPQKHVDKGASDHMQNAEHILYNPMPCRPSPPKYKSFTSIVDLKTGDRGTPVQRPLSGLGEQEIGCNTTVAITELSTFQQKFLSWKNRYESDNKQDLAEAEDND